MGQRHAASRHSLRRHVAAIAMGRRVNDIGGSTLPPTNQKSNQPWLLAAWRALVEEFRTAARRLNLYPT